MRRRIHAFVSQSIHYIMTFEIIGTKYMKRRIHALVPCCIHYIMTFETIGTRGCMYAPLPESTRRGFRKRPRCPLCQPWFRVQGVGLGCRIQCVRFILGRGRFLASMVRLCVWYRTNRNCGRFCTR